MNNDPRLLEARHWLVEGLGLALTSLQSASADASFRRYFRALLADGSTRILMDAPPDKEDLGLYLRVTGLIEGCGLHVPHVEAADTDRGFALIEDLGSTHMLTGLAEGRDPDILYREALEALARLHLAGDAASRELPPYDEAVLLREMRLMPEWFCARHLGLAPDAARDRMLEEAFAYLAQAVLEQPRVFVHRDYHSRNLMLVGQRSPGVIDFQDALRGPVAYDLASILKDCYVAWPRKRVEGWVDDFRAMLQQGGAAGARLAGQSRAQFLDWFDLIGLQRHIKVLGIFARLNWRDGKAGYLADLPRTLDYVREAAPRFAPLAGFSRFIEEQVAPRLAAANERAVSHARGTEARA
jgi:aminoglycoside/choline kinase family phosphotransferase